MKWYYDYLPVDNSGNIDFSAYLERGASGDHILWLPILILVCIIAIWFICKFVRNLHKNDWYDSDSLLEGNMMIVNAALVVVTNLLIIFYVLSSGASALWFMYADENGDWTRTVICGIVYLYALVNLLVGFLKTMDDFSGEIDGRINCKWGLTTLALGIVALVICGISSPENVIYIIWALIFCQVIQIAIIFYKALNKGFLTALAACCTYIICSIGLLVFAAPFILLLVILAILLFISIFGIKKMQEDINKRDVLVYDDGRIVDKYNRTEYKQNSDGTISKK